MKNLMLANILATVSFNAVASTGISKCAAAQNRATHSAIAGSASGQRIAQIIAVSRFDFASIFAVVPSQSNFAATGAVVALLPQTSIFNIKALYD